MSDRVKAILLLALTALFWSSGGLAIKLIDLHPMAITGVRSAIAAATLALLFRKHLCFVFTPAGIGAAAGYAGLLISNVIATKLTTAANAILLAYTAPIYVALLAPWVLREQTRRSDWIFIAVTVAGMVLFFMDRLSTSGLWGNLMGMCTGLSYAVFTLCMRAQKDASPMGSVIMGHALTAVCGLPFLFGSLPAPAGWAGPALPGHLPAGDFAGAVRLGHQTVERSGSHSDHDPRTRLQSGLGGFGIRRTPRPVGRARRPGGHRRGHPAWSFCRPAGQTSPRGGERLQDKQFGQADCAPP